MIKKVGSVNPCGFAALVDENGTIIGKCFDTPNAIAVAMQYDSRISKSIAYYPLFGYSEHKRAEIVGRYIDEETSKKLLATEIEIYA